MVRTPPEPIQFARDFKRRYPMVSWSFDFGWRSLGRFGPRKIGRNEIRAMIAATLLAELDPDLEPRFNGGLVGNVELAARGLCLLEEEARRAPTA